MVPHEFHRLAIGRLCLYLASNAPLHELPRVALAALHLGDQRLLCGRVAVDQVDGMPRSSSARGAADAVHVLDHIGREGVLHDHAHLG